MDPLAGTAQILSMLQTHLPQLIKAVHKITPDGRGDKIVADMRRSASELQGCADAGVLAHERVNEINDLIDAYVVRSFASMIIADRDAVWSPDSRNWQGARKSGINGQRITEC